jgi:hypothetical protein
VISLAGSVVDGGKNVFALERWEIFKDFFDGSPGAEQLKNVGNADTLPTNTRTSSTFSLFHGDPAQTL